MHTMIEMRNKLLDMHPFIKAKRSKTNRSKFHQVLLRLLQQQNNYHHNPVKLDFDVLKSQLI